MTPDTTRPPLIAWLMDIAREQHPTIAGLRDILRRSRAAGYEAVGLYLEHRFAYRSAPWAAADGVLTPAAVRELATEGVRLIPFLNTLGHCEGFIRSEGGQHLAEGPHTGLGLQLCATRPECAAFARGLVEDALDAFDDEWLHLGGDETRQLGQCPECAARVAAVGRGGLYGEYFAPLCRLVLARGRRPCLWGDMLLRHPEALAALPPQTLIFDWQYDATPHASTALFRRHGFDVVCCPSLHSYDSAWCFWGASRRNIDEHAAAAAELGATGVLVTTWELCQFSNYPALLPLVYAAGRRLAQRSEWRAALEAESSPGWAAAAELLGETIPAASPFLAEGTWRQLREQLVMCQNPFYLWESWRAEACGPIGTEILRHCQEADACLEPADPLRFAVLLHRVAVQWVRLVEECRQLYRAGQLHECRQRLLWAAIPLLSQLNQPLRQIARAGGSRADLARLDRLLEHVKCVARRVDGLLGGSAYRPAFETLVHEAYTPGDQAAWRTGAYR